MEAIYGPKPTLGSGEGGIPSTEIQDPEYPAYYSQLEGSGGRTHGNDRGGRDSGLQPRLTQPNVVTFCPPPTGPYGRGRGGESVWTRGSGATGPRDTRYSGEGPGFGRGSTSGAWNQPRTRKKNRGPKWPPMPVRGPVVTPASNPATVPPSTTWAGEPSRNQRQKKDDARWKATQRSNAGPGLMSTDNIDGLLITTSDDDDDEEEGAAGGGKKRKRCHETSYTKLHNIGTLPC